MLCLDLHAQQDTRIRTPTQMMTLTQTLQSDPEPAQQLTDMAADDGAGVGSAVALLPSASVIMSRSLDACTTTSSTLLDIRSAASSKSCDTCHKGIFQLSRA